LNTFDTAFSPPRAKRDSISGVPQRPGVAGKNNFYRILKKYKRILSMTPLTFGGSGKRMDSTEFPENSERILRLFDS
jgi:hypothetical protein